LRQPWVQNNYLFNFVAVSDKFLALGTHLGYVYILDFEGHTNQQHIFRPHTGSVNDLSIDEYGEYIASCSNDGRPNNHFLTKNRQSRGVQFIRK
jgi:WD40 repeat protein